MDPVNVIPNILVSHLSTSPTAKLAMTTNTDMSQVQVETIMSSNTYTSVQLELNTEPKKCFKLLLGLDDSADFTAQGVTLVNAGALATKPGVAGEVLKVCTLQYFSKTENKLQNLEIVVPDTPKQLDDVVETNKSLILSEDQVEFFTKLVARIGSKSFITSAIANVAILPRINHGNELDSLNKISVDFSNVEEMFVKVSLTNRLMGVVIRQEVATAIFDKDIPLRSTMVKSEDYCLLVCSGVSPNSNISYILCIPHTDIPKLPNQPEMWRNVQLVLQSKMCKVVFNNSQQSTFSASVPNDFKSVSFIVTSRKPFVIQEDILVKIEQECYQQTLLPFILSDPIPNHIQQLSRHSPQTPFPHPPIAVVSRTPTPPTPEPLLPTQPPIRLASPAPNIDMAPARTMVFHTARPMKTAQAPPLLPPVATPPAPPTPPSTCPACSVPISLDKPSDVPEFAKHFYMHFPISSKLIPEFLERFSIMLDMKKNVTITSCPFYYCSNMSEKNPNTQNMEKHLRRKHQFEILCFQLSTLSQEFEGSHLFSQLMKNCKIDHAKLFIKANLKKFRNIQTVDEVRIKSELTSEPSERASEAKEETKLLEQQEINVEQMSIKVATVAKPEEELKSAPVTEDTITASVKEVVNNEPEIRTVREEEPIIVKSESIEIIDKSVVINKNQATEIMKQFFRANVKDEDCRFFLKSRGEEMPIGMVDKLVFFLFDVSSSYQESLQLVKFAVKNLKRIVQKDGSHLSVSFIFETDSFLQMKTIHKHILQYKAYCKLLQMNPKNCNSEILVSVISKLLKQYEGEVSQFPLFLNWLGKTHHKKGGKSVDQLDGIVQLTLMVTAGEGFMNLSKTETTFKKNVLKCEKCGETFDDVISILLHTGNHGEEPVKVICTKCEDTVETIFLREKKDTLAFRAILNLHLQSKTHLHNVLNDGKLPVSQTECNACDASFSSPSEIVQHSSTRNHAANSKVVEEYLEFCLGHQIDPVNHAEFPHFIFFLRCIHSLSVNLQVPIRQTMDVVSNIHSNFDNLLNVNESSDVKDEVVRKLSCGEPAIFFCYTCNQSFLTVSDVEEHLSSEEHEDSLVNNEIMTARCVVCKSFVMQGDLQNHDHKIIDVTEDGSESPAVEVIDIDEGHVNPNTEVKESPSEQLVSGDEDISVPPCATEEIIENTEEVSLTDEASVIVEESEINAGHVLASPSPDEIESCQPEMDDQIENNVEQVSDGKTMDNVEIVQDVLPASFQVEPTDIAEKISESDHLEEGATEGDVLSEVFNVETVAIVEANATSEIMSKCDQTIDWLLKEQDKTKSLKNSFLSREIVSPTDTESELLTEVVGEEQEQLSFGNPDNYTADKASDSPDLMQNAIFEANISEDGFQEVVKSNGINCVSRDDVPSDNMNDNVTFEEKLEKIGKNMDQNNSNVPSWEFVPIKGQNFQFHVLPSVDSIPPDPVENIQFDMSLQEILEMHKKKGGFFQREVESKGVSGEKRKVLPDDNNPESCLVRYKKLRMYPRISLTPCEIPSSISDQPDEKIDVNNMHEDLDIPAENVLKINADDICPDQEIIKVSSKKEVLIPKVMDGSATGDDVSNNFLNQKDEEVFEQKDHSEVEPVKRGRGRPRKSLIKPDDTSNPSKEPEPILIQESKSTKPKDKPSDEGQDEEINQEQPLEAEGMLKAPKELHNETSSTPLHENPSKDDVTLTEQDSNEIVNTDFTVKKLMFSSRPNQDRDANTLESEFDFNSVESTDIEEVSEEQDDDSSSEYEDSDDELEIIEEIIVEEPSEKTLDISGVKLEPKELIEKVADKSSKPPGVGDLSEFQPAVSKQGEPMADVVVPEDKNLPCLEVKEKQLKTTKNIVEGNTTEKSSKRKMEVLKSDEIYQPVMVDVKLHDIALDSDWREHVEPQVKYLKRRAAVINRWENDIQAYFKQRS